MASRRRRLLDVLFVFSLIIASSLLFSPFPCARADEESPPETLPPEAGDGAATSTAAAGLKEVDTGEADAVLKELELARQRISVLEESMYKRDLDLEEKDNAISSLQANIRKLQKKEGAEADAALKNIKAKLDEREAKVVELEHSLKETESKLETSAAQVQALEAGQSQFTGQIKKLEKNIAEQKKRLEKAEQAIRVSEAAVKRVQAEADAKNRELLEMHSQWLPPWGWNAASNIQAFASKHWKNYGKPLVAASVEMVSQKAAAVHSWSKPHITTVQEHVEKKWLPVVKQNWEKVVVTIAPHIETARGKALKGYESSKEFMIPHIERTRKTIEPYTKATKEACRPHVDRVAVIVRPYFEQVKVISEPYTKRVARTYKNTLTAATKRHHQVQSWLHSSMKKHEILAGLANKELVWFLASALLVLPILGVFLFLSSFSSPKRPTNPVKSQAHKGEKKHRRPKAEK